MQCTPQCCNRLVLVQVAITCPTTLSPMPEKSYSLQFIVQNSRWLWRWSCLVFIHHQSAITPYLQQRKSNCHVTENDIKKHKMNGSLLPAMAWQAMERWGVEMGICVTFHRSSSSLYCVYDVYNISAVKLDNPAVEFWQTWHRFNIVNYSVSLGSPLSRLILLHMNTYNTAVLLINVDDIVADVKVCCF